MGCNFWIRDLANSREFHQRVFSSLLCGPDRAHNAAKQETTSANERVLQLNESNA